MSGVRHFARILMTFDNVRHARIEQSALGYTTYDRPAAALQPLMKLL